MSDPNAEQVAGEDTRDLTDQEVDTRPAVSEHASVISDASWEAATAAWINDHVRNSPIAGATEAWNHLMGALSHLRAALETELGKKE